MHILGLMKAGSKQRSTGVVLDVSGIECAAETLNLREGIQVDDLTYAITSAFDLGYNLISMIQCPKGT